MEQFSHNNLPQLANFLQPPPQDFATENTLVHTKIYNHTSKKIPKKISNPSTNITLHPEITKLLINSFKTTHSYYSSLLTYPMQLTHYNSSHSSDILLGSMGHAKSFKWYGVGLAYPTNHNTTLKAIHWARVEAKEDAHTITILIVNHKDWTPQQLPITKHVDIHTIVIVPPHTINFDPTLEWPEYYWYIEQSLTSIICILNQSNPTKNTQNPQELQYVI